MLKLAELPDGQRTFYFKFLFSLVFLLLVPLMVIVCMFGPDLSHPVVGSTAKLFFLVGFPCWVVICSWRAIAKFRN